MNIVDDIVFYTGLSATDVRRVIWSAPKRYKTFNISKRSGGEREIAQPSRELKLIQRFVQEKYLSHLPVHSSATAYASGRNIFDNASYHKDSEVILKLDFENFFPSIKKKDWEVYAHVNCPELLIKENDGILANILFWGQGSYVPRCLSIGAPTSPLISNLLMFDFDVRVSKSAVQRGLVYTRYADDITISGNNSDGLLSFEKEIRKLIRQLKSPKLKFNDEKRGIYDRGNKQLVTGLIITPDHKISIGRTRKREISTLIHRYGLGKLDWSEKGYLKGMLGFSIANESIFVTRMRSKYGDEVINEILQLELPKKGRS